MLIPLDLPNVHARPTRWALRSRRLAPVAVALIVAGSALPYPSVVVHDHTGGQHAHVHEDPHRHAHAAEHAHGHGHHHEINHPGEVERQESSIDTRDDGQSLPQLIPQAASRHWHSYDPYTLGLSSLAGASTFVWLLGERLAPPPGHVPARTLAHVRVRGPPAAAAVS